MVADFTSGCRFCTEPAMPLKSAATTGRVLALRPFTSPVCTWLSMDRAALARALRSAGVICDCVMQEAARATGAKTPKPATKHRGRAHCPILIRRNMPHGLSVGKSEHKRNGTSAGTHNWMQVRRDGQVRALIDH